MAELLPVQLLTMVQVEDIFCLLTRKEKAGSRGVGVATRVVAPR